MTSLLEQAIARQRPTGPECGVVKARKARPELAGQIDELLTHMASEAPPRIAFTTASLLLKEQDLHVPSDSISRHLRGQCSCGK